ncbi:MAG: DUF3048 domain-containing protein [Firmicutes bacterium]|nr:DUF3048 domain-containing protein [Bacillota bacterium]
MRSTRSLLITLLLFCFFTVIISSTVYGSPEETQKEIAELEAALKEFEKTIAAREERIKELNLELEKAEKQLAETELALAESEAKLAEKNHIFGQRVRSAYMSGSLSYLDIILDAKSFGDLIFRFVYLTRVLGRDAEIVSALRQEYELLEERKMAMVAEKEKLEDLRYQIEAEYKNLLDQKAQMNKLLQAAKDKLADEMAKSIPQAERKAVYGVVIDNHAAARPQYGLAQANVVYEYEVEGRITRYLALFAAFPSKVGPLRSARQHNIILALENDVRFVHAGGSSDNIQLIADLNLRATDALKSSSLYFYRDSSRRAPHNLYVNLQALQHESPSKVVTVRPAFLSREGKPGRSLSITYSGSHRVSYSYVADKGYYHRYINGSQHFDGNGAAIQARNIIVQYVPFYNDFAGRPTANLVGEGPIDFYCQGQYFRGKWVKSDNKSPTRFYYEDGQEIERIYGQTWIQIVRK